MDFSGFGRRRFDCCVYVVLTLQYFHVVTNVVTVYLKVFALKDIGLDSSVGIATCFYGLDGPGL